MLKVCAVTALLVSSSVSAALASSDSGISYRCQKSGGKYVMINGSRCFPHKSVEQAIRKQRGVVVSH